MHSLTRHEERLEDLSNKRAQLERRMDEKRLELLGMKQRELAERRASDPALQAQMDALVTKLSAYQSPPKPAEPAPAADSGLIRLSRKGDARDRQTVSQGEPS